MACKFCPKIRGTDLLFMLVAGVAFYGVYSYQMRQIDKDAQVKRAKAFEQLQRACVFEHKKDACQQVFSPSRKP
ncbi:hypothetical protein ACFOPX_00320 [Helicobacter baculiformis]|uniref:Uncharacterized protein n=1 Tax=Helicobacter baculiformis TaxID=427351 RepID=A0ABV7ZEI2_9HELI|nr:hypothetical protein [Helicobacter baculiformis]